MASSKGLLVFELQNEFKDEQACLDYLEQARWQGKPRCARCQSENVHRYAKGKRAGKLWQCNDCLKQFSVKVGTIFQGSRIPLLTWFRAIWLFTAHKKGVSSLQLSRNIGVTQKTAWYMLSRLRCMMNDETIIFGEHEVVEVDEGYFGGLEANKHMSKHTPGTQGRSSKTKTILVALKSRGGKVKTFVISRADKRTLQGIIRKYVAKGATVYTDKYRAYRGLSVHFTHDSVDHAKGEYVRDNTHTNTVENHWSHMKRRGAMATYHVISQKHFQRYCDEFDYRANTRALTDAERFRHSLQRVAGRLRYKDLIANDPKSIRRKSAKGPEREDVASALERIAQQQRH